MPSQKQIDANRLNAQKSTGPRTPEGRAAVRLNALKHGLTAEDLLIDVEDQAAFNELLKALHAEYEPQTPTEHILLEQLICAAWRLRRARMIEQGIFNVQLADTSEFLEAAYEDPHESVRLGHVFRQDAAGPQALVNLSRYEARIERSYYKALRELQHLRVLRAKQNLQKQTQSEPAPAAIPIESIPPDSPRPSIPALSNATVPHRSIEGPLATIVASPVASGDPPNPPPFGI